MKTIYLLLFLSPLNLMMIIRPILIIKSLETQ